MNEHAEHSEHTDEVLTRAVVAERLHVHEQTISTWCRTRGFPHHRIGKVLRFLWSDVTAWVKKQENPNGSRAA